MNRDRLVRRVVQVQVFAKGRRAEVQLTRPTHRFVRVAELKLGSNGWQVEPDLPGWTAFSVPADTDFANIALELVGGELVKAKFDGTCCRVHLRLPHSRYQTLVHGGKTDAELKAKRTGQEITDVRAT